MIELIDIDGNIKFMSLIICGINYGNQDYVIYSIKRDEEEDNIFVSKLVKSSSGSAMDNNFSGGEKEALEDVVKSIISKDNIDVLKSKGIALNKDIDLVKINKFSVMNCYVTTVRRSLVREIMSNYGLFDSSKKKTVVKERDVSYFSKNNFPVLLLIILGVVVVVIFFLIILNFFK